MSVLNYLKEFRNRAKEPRPAESYQIDVESVLRMSLSDFKAADLAVLVRSHLLGEDILLISNERCFQSINGQPVAYLPEELEIVHRLSMDTMRKVHEIKKRFDGRIIGYERNSGGAS